MKFSLCINVLVLSLCFMEVKAEDSKNFNMGVIPEGKAVIYVYRPSQFVNSAGYPYTYIDGEKKNPLYNGSYKAYFVSPGAHKVETIGGFWAWGLPDNKVDVTTEEGKRYYVRLTSGISDITIISSSVYMGKSLNFGSIPENIAVKEMSELNTPEELEKKWADEKKEEEKEWDF
jgi:hypothetical protein